MSYKPRPDSEKILRRAWMWVQSVAYAVTARWVFYRLLQDGTYYEKSGYKHLLGLLSKARKEFYLNWRPWTLADDTRAPILMQRNGYYKIYLRGSGFDSEQAWLDTLKRELNCPLDRWASQPVYTEIWFEAAAMQGQFLHYANENIPLVAFKGDFTIDPKWKTAERLAEAWLKYRKRIEIYYYGDYDPKGIIIPDSAWSDILLWAYSIVAHKENRKSASKFHEDINFTRIGINEEQIEAMNLPENPERPGTYQWEALDDEQAEVLIEMSATALDMDAFADIKAQEEDIIKRFWEDLGK